MKKYLLNIILMPFMLSGLTATLQAQDMLEDTIRIEEVVVTGSPVKINRNNVPMSVSVVTNAQINENNEY